MYDLLREFPGAWQQLRRARGFTILAVTLLAAGLGATVGVFSLLHSLVLRPLPFAQPDELVGLQALNAAKAIRQDQLSVADFADLAEHNRSFSTLGAYRPNFASYTRPDEAPLRLITGLVTEQLLDTFGVRPHLGRVFAPSEFTAGAGRVIILSHAAWQRWFGGRDDVVGQLMTLDDGVHTVIGVMPDVFREPAFVDAWLPFPREAPEYLARDSRFWVAVGRLAPGVGLAAARAELAGLSADLARAYPESNRDWAVSAIPLQELRTRALRPALLLLLTAVGLILVIACLNLANLLLARGLAQRLEVGVRLALGATPRRLAARILLECLLVALLGAAIGGGLAAAGLQVVARYLPAAVIPRAQEIALYPPALGVAVTLAVLSALTCGLLPAWQVRRADVRHLLQGGSRGSTFGATRWQAFLVVGQVALTVTVLAGALLLMKSLQRLQDVPPGFDPAGVVVLALAPPPERHETADELAAYYQDLIEAAQGAPGVAGAGVNASLPFSGVALTNPTWIVGRPRDAASAHEAVYAPVSEGYFELLRQPLRAGRDFTAHDGSSGAPVAIVNEAYARQVFPGESALGQQVLLLPWMGPHYREIVGVVADTHQLDLATSPPPQVYVPQRQMPWFFSTLVVRLEQPGAINALRHHLQAVDPTLPFAPRSWAEDLAGSATQPLLYTGVFSGFALIACGLCAFGIYASLHCSLRQRVREIGIRVALGATPVSIACWMLRHASTWVAAGTALGLVGAALLAAALHSQLYGVAVLDPLVFLALPVIAAALALAAALPLAIRAARLHPTEALQHD